MIPSVLRTVRMSIEKFAPHVCPACGARPEIDHLTSINDGREVFRAYCHGSLEKFYLDAAAIARPDYLGLRMLHAWIDGLFKLDANPDVRELLHYNRGKAPN